MDFYLFFDSLSDTLKGVVIAGLFSVITVLLTIFATAVSGFLQSRREQAVRAYNLKKDVLLETVRATTESAKALGHTYNPEISNADIGLLFNSAASVTQAAHVVGNRKTVESLRKLTECGLKEFAIALARRTWMMEMHHESQMAGERSDDLWKQSVELSRRIDSLAAENAPKEVIKPAYDQLENIYESWQKSSNTRLDAQNEALRRQQVITFEGAPRLKVLNVAQAKFVGEVRRELGIDRWFSKPYSSYGIVNSDEAMKELDHFFKEALKRQAEGAD